MTWHVRSHWLQLGAAVLALLLGALLGSMRVALLRQPTDFSIYYAAARVLAAGGDPYNWHALQRVVPHVIAPGYVYPPWGLLPALAVAWLPLPVASGVWMAASCCCLAFAIWSLCRAAGLSSRSLWQPTLVGIACLSVPGVFVLIQGQISLLLLAALVGAYAALRLDHPRWTGLLLALALAKPQLTLLPVLALLVVALRRQRLATVARWTGAALGLLILMSFAARPDWVGRWLAALGADAEQGGSGAHALRANMGTIPALAAHLPLAVGIGLLLAALASGGYLLLLLARLLYRQDSVRAELELFAGAICVGSVLSPWMWIYDGVVWLVPLVVLIAWGSHWRKWLGLLVFWALPWGVRLWHVAGSASGGTSLNKIEDVLIAPLLLALLFAPAPELIAARGWARLAASQASASRPAIRSVRQIRSGNTAESAGQARRPATAPRRPVRPV